MLVAAFLDTPGVTTVTVRSVNRDTGATIATATGVRALKKGGSGDALDTVRGVTCQWRLLMDDVPFEVEPLHQVDESDGTTWQIQPESKVEREVFGRFRVCQCAEIVGAS